MRVLISLVLSIIVLEKTNGDCTIRHGDICDVMQCTDKTGKLYISKSHASNGSVCFFRCANETFTTRKTCSDGKWSFTDQKGYSFPTEHDVLIRTKRGWFGKVVKGFVRGIGCLLTLGLLCGNRHRDNTPPSIQCPPDLHNVSDDLQDHATVSWKEPLANDNGVSIRATRVGLAPGLQFSKGDTKISYYARDRSGNWGSCSFNIHITVPICTGLSKIKDGYYICHTSFEMRKGTRCQFGCYEGHILVGERSIQCTESATWTGRQPSCKRVTCEKLLVPEGMTMSCSDMNNFRSKCSYSCREGFDISPGMTRVRVCTSTGKWRGSIPTCRDILPPVITNCTGAVYGFADRDSVSGRLVWDKFKPSAHDNADMSVTLNQTAGPDSYMNNLRAGTYDVTFDATDRAGNKAFQCKMKIVMKVLRCPKVYNLPLQTVICEGGSKFGAECNFTCANGSVINGSRQAICEKGSNGQYVTWHWGSHQPFCEAQHLCEDRLEPPSHGAVACDYWLGGKFCQMLCRKGYDVPAGYQFPEMYVCGESGLWTPGSKLPNCARTHSSHQAIMAISMDYYFDGDCRNSTVTDSIRQKFVQALTQSVYMDACKTNEESCFPMNVEVICGSQAGKRAAGIVIEFDLAITTVTAFGNRSFAKLNEKMKGLFVNVSDESAALDINMDDNITLIVQEVHNNGLRIVCDGQTIPSYASESCMECPAGTFYDDDAQVCPLCPIGQYQPSAAQSTCIQCPTGRSTRHKGALSKNECEVACVPGTYSKIGLPPCSLCEIGTYTNTYGATECTLCSGSRTTIQEGETSVTSCKDFDLVITSAVGNFILPLNVTLSRPASFIVSFWIMMDGSTELGSVLNIVYPDKQLDIALNRTGIKLQGFGFKATADLLLNDTKWNYMVVDVSKTEVYLDSERIVLQKYPYNQGNHTENGDSHVEIGGGDFVGGISQLNIWSTGRGIDAIVKGSSHCRSTTQGDILGWKQFESVDDNHIFLQIPSECDVDGEWSVWSNWSMCSTTCGEGTTYRTRLCNSPTPDNGGKDCSGDTTEHDTCDLGNCTVCTNLTTPAHAVLDCQWASSEDAINCTLSCDDGYDFDHAAKESYRCGPDTFHLWDFQTDDNPYGRLPDCTRIMDGNKLEWKYMASYFDLVCDSEAKAEIVEKKIKKAVYEGTDSLTCQQDGSCSLVDIEVTSCSKNRLKRSVSPTTAGFAADFTCDARKFTSDGCRDIVTRVLNEMLTKIGGDVFNTMVDGLEYSIMENSSMFGGRSYCSAGMVPVQHYCVPCSLGRYHSGDECKKCAVGSYQSQVGKTSCVNCPVGFTTEGQASIGVEDCNVRVDIPSHTVPVWKYGVPVGLGVGFGIVCVVVSILLWRKIRAKKRDRKIKDIYEPYSDCNNGQGMTSSKPKYLSAPEMITPVADDHLRTDSTLKETLSARQAKTMF
ncbi:uncharacterized protein LOC110446988 isoform X2 [Mizuhopecten yessoensis]|uniref:uncharacterized protein LOC110446988 isoform X2 n=1 Tax=Mizuhopecten yessoensis TaxID=6573 RepID=UPI000B45C114|nr:uncharacterized protein LOC110446988 isoform X2 [Mizuhopecten yessoensis]